jgi:hypothetical protein
MTISIAAITRQLRAASLHHTPRFVPGVDQESYDDEVQFFLFGAESSFSIQIGGGLFSCNETHFDKDGHVEAVTFGYERRTIGEAVRDFIKHVASTDPAPRMMAMG